MILQNKIVFKVIKYSYIGLLAKPQLKYHLQMEGLFTIIGAFLGGGAFKSLIDYIISYKKKKSRNSFQKLFEEVHKIYQILNNIKRETFAKRIIIATAENGGGIPTVDSDLKSSIKYETYDYPFHTVKEQWQYQTLSEHHLMLLRKMYLNGKTEFHVDDLPEGNLKDALEAADVIYVKLFIIVATEKKLYYVSLHYHKEYNGFKSKPNERNAIRASVNKLKPIFNVMEEKV